MDFWAPLTLKEKLYIGAVAGGLFTGCTAFFSVIIWEIILWV